MRDHVVAPQQHPVEGAGRGDQAVAVGRGDDLLDQRVDHRVLDAGVVAAARGVGGNAGPVVVLLVARRQRLAEDAGDHVEVKVLEALLVLGRIDQPDLGRDAEFLQVLDEGRDDALELRRDDEELDFHGLAAGAGKPGILDCPAGLAQQLERRAQVAPRVARAVGRGRRVGLAEDLGRELTAEGFEQRQLGRVRQARRRQLGVREIARGAGVGAVEQVLVGPLEVEGVGERLAHLGVGELGEPGVEDEALHAGGNAVADLLLDDQPLVEGRPFVGGRPHLGGILLAEVVLVRLQRLHRHGGIAVVVVADHVEVVLAAPDGQLGAPVVGDPAVGDRAAGVDAFDAVGAAAHGRLERRLLEVVGREVGLREDRHLTHDQRQLAVEAHGEGEFHLALADLLGLQRVAIIGAVEGVAPGLEGIERKHHVVDGDRRAVVPARLGAQGEGDPRAVLGHFDLFGDQAVLRERLVLGPGHQRLEHLAQASRRLALEDERVEVVEAADRVQSHFAALGRVRVGVIEVGEVGAVFQIAVHRHAVAGVDILGRARGGRQNERGGGEGDENAHERSCGD